MEQLTKKNKIYWILPICFLFLFSFFYLISNLLHSSFNKSNNALFIIGKELNTVNNNLVKKMDNDFKDVDNLTNVFSETVASLNSLIEVIDNHYYENEDYKNLIISSISSNIYFYDACIKTLNNRSDLDSSYELDKFTSLKNSCISNYNNLLTILDLDFDFVKNMDEAFDSYYLSLNILIKENRDRAFKERQQKDFLNNINELNKLTTSLNEDLMPAILRIRDEDRTLSVILDDIQLKEENYKNIKSKLISISLPEGTLEFYNSFSEYLDLYEIYLSNLKSAVILEYSSKSYEDNAKEIDRHYKNAISKRNDVLKVYDSYINLFSS